MKPSIRGKLETLSERLQELDALLADPDVITSQERFRDLSKEYAQLNPVVACFELIKARSPTSPRRAR